MTPQMNPGGLTDDELLRLARLLQQTRGEGLAFINPGEAQMLRDAGGSGEPIPGTQGFGVGGGPIRSYETTPGSDDESEGTSLSDAYSQGTTSSNPTGGTFSTLGGGNDDDRRSTPPSGDDDDPFQLYSGPPTPRFGPDLDGGMHFTQAELDAANRRIRTRKAKEAITNQSSNFKTDFNFNTWYAQNKDSLGLDDSYKADLEDSFNQEMLKVYDEARIQTKNLTDNITTALRQLDQSQLEGLTYDQIEAQITNYLPEGATDRISENTRREIVSEMGRTALREARFTLTPEEVDAFARQAITATQVADAERPEIQDIAPAEQVTVDEVAAPDRVVIGEIGELNRDLIDNVVEGENELADYLLQRIRGEATSPAELQLKRATEQNLRNLLGASAGTADPAKLRQIRNIYSETAQVLSGQAAELRSREQIDAENRLVQVYKQQGDRELQVAMVNLETKKQEAFKQADLDQVRNLNIQQANLQRVITKANLDRDVELANLDTRRQKALSQGQIDVAVALANLEKDITLSKLDAELALRSRALDDALALANYQGQMALEGIEVKIDLAEMEADVRQELARLGIDSAEKIAQLNADTQLAIGNLNAQASKYAADSKERAAIIGAVGAIVGVGIKAFAGGFG